MVGRSSEVPVFVVVADEARRRNGAGGSGGGKRIDLTGPYF
jgi:hypothetical protein